MEKLLLEHLWIVIVVLLLTLPFKAAALWRSARRSHLGWFLALLILNTLAILDILYIFVFSSWGLGKKDNQEKPEQNKQQQPPQTRQPQFSSSSKSKMTIM